MANPKRVAKAYHILQRDSRREQHGCLISLLEPPRRALHRGVIEFRYEHCHPTRNQPAQTVDWIAVNRQPALYNHPMSAATPQYDPRYLAGVTLFNQHEFFEAHEVWESLWLSADVGEDRRFVQGLIQAAVGLYHFSTLNTRGARKLYHTARAY